MRRLLEPARDFTFIPTKLSDHSLSSISRWWLVFKMFCSWGVCFCEREPDYLKNETVYPPRCWCAPRKQTTDAFESYIPVLLPRSLQEDHLTLALGRGRRHWSLICANMKFSALRLPPAVTSEHKNIRQCLLRTHYSPLRISEDGDRNVKGRKDSRVGLKVVRLRFFFFLFFALIAQPLELQSNLPGMWSYP